MAIGEAVVPPSVCICMRLLLLLQANGSDQMHMHDDAGLPELRLDFLPLAGPPPSQRDTLLAARLTVRVPGQSAWPLSPGGPVPHNPRCGSTVVQQHLRSKHPTQCAAPPARAPRLPRPHSFASHRVAVVASVVARSLPSLFDRPFSPQFTGDLGSQPAFPLDTNRDSTTGEWKGPVGRRGALSACTAGPLTLAFGKARPVARGAACSCHRGCQRDAAERAAAARAPRSAHALHRSLGSRKRRSRVKSTDAAVAAPATLKVAALCCANASFSGGKGFCGWVGVRCRLEKRAATNEPASLSILGLDCVKFGHGSGTREAARMADSEGGGGHPLHSLTPPNHPALVSCNSCGDASRAGIPSRNRVG
eukprot:359501-Chlamydomonas_euryale.AAC.10